MDRAGRHPPPTPWWRTARRGVRRRSATARPGARRPFGRSILYPMNALVDDQLMRLRRALDSDTARDWLDAHRRGHRFYFGRYTGATPVTGGRDQPRLRGERPATRTCAPPNSAAPVPREVSREPGNEDVQLLRAAARRRRDALALGHVGRAAGHPDHQLLDAQRDAAARA